MLEVTDLNAYYGKSHILRGVNLKIENGEIVSLLGRSTTCKAIMGEVEPIGSIKFNGAELAGKKAFEVANAGLGYVPENRDIFPGLTTRQNLELGIKTGQDMANSRWSIDDMFNLFENLKNRADVEASFLSGGEQQMLTMCRTLMGDPEVIMIDEPTEGLSPQMTTRVADLLNEISSRGVSILLVEQKLAIAMKISHRVYVMGHGQIVFEGTPTELDKREDIRKEWLEV
ncbi:ABC transporter ATP-binding protein [Paracoccaceae bacterium]|nr:ABC transporter ATP-binding protein [Paracoccaceae bacterium]